MEIDEREPRTVRLDGCPACGSHDSRQFFSSPDRLHGTPGSFVYEICAKCRTVFQNPMVVDDDLHLCYPDEYSPYNVKRELPPVDFENLPENGLRNSLRKAVVDVVRGRSVDGLTGTFGRLLARSGFIRERAFFGIVDDAMLPRGGGSHHALDLGCGAGWLMEKLAKVGWTVEGLEWNDEAAARAREINGANVFAGDFRELEMPVGKYDLIVLNHVFEHFRDPNVVLRRIRELLKTGGTAILLYPNPHSYGAGWFLTDWFPWEVPRHLVLPTPEAIRLMAKAAGFSRADVSTRTTYTEEHWIRSTAYQLGLNPEQHRPALGMPAKSGCLTERLLTAAGFEKGWEIVAKLGK